MFRQLGWQGLATLAIAIGCLALAVWLARTYPV